MASGEGSLGRRKAGGLSSAAISLIAALAVGALGAIATRSSVPTWYAALAKPAFSPPNWVFAPVWTVLYVLMALAAWRAWRAPAQLWQRRRAVALHGAQLVLNLAWSLIFFGLRWPGAALAEIIVLLAAIVVTSLVFWRLDRFAGALMLPYIIWVCFAAVLNLGIWRLN